MTAITLSDLNSNLESQNNILEKVQKSSERMSSELSAFVKSLTSFKGDELEAEREGGAVAGAAAGGGALGGLAGGDLFGGLFKGLLPLIAGVGGALLASFTEFGNDLARTFASVFAIDKFSKGLASLRSAFSLADDAPLPKFFKGLKTGFLQAIGSIGEDGKKIVARTSDGTFRKTYANRIIDFFDSIGASFKAGLDAITDTVKAPFTKFKNLFMGEKTIFGALGRFADSVSEFMGPIVQRISFAFSAEGGFGKLMTGLQNAVDFVADSPIGKALSTLGGVLKKIFLPIGLIFTAYDTVKGAIEGYEEGGVAGALGGAIKGLLASVVGAPLDLLRSAVAFILEKVGMENAADYLKSFNVSDIIGRAIDSIPIMFKSAINGILETVAQLLEDSYVASGFADDVRGLKFEIKKPEAVKPSEGTEAGSTAAEIISQETLPDGTTVTKGIDADGFEYTETKRPTTEKATVAGAGAGAVPAGTLKTQTDEMNQLANQPTAPVIIQDNSSRVTGGNSSQGVVMNTNPFDLYDPMVRA